MTIAVRMRVSGFDAQKFVNKLSTELPSETNKSLYTYGKRLAKKLGVAAVTDNKRPLTPDRKEAAANIRAVKKGNGEVDILMSRGLSMLDSMSPHYVSLKSGRNITRWARRNYGSARVSGLSTARIKNHRLIAKSKSGGVPSYGALYVTPHRFVHKTLNKERNKLPNSMRRGIRRAIKASVV